MIKIVDARWTREVNLLTLGCSSCLQTWQHRADRRTVRCPNCGTLDDILGIRDRENHEEAPGIGDS